MFERDYLMRLLWQFTEAIRRSWERCQHDEDPQGAADTLEGAIGEATDIDGETLLALEPESLASVLMVTDTDPNVIEYVARSLALASVYHKQAGDDGLSALRLDQAQTLAAAYGLYLPDDPAQLAEVADKDDAEVAEGIAEGVADSADEAG